MYSAEDVMSLLEIVLIDGHNRRQVHKHNQRNRGGA